MHDRNYLSSLWKNAVNSFQCSKALRRGELFAYSDSETELKQKSQMFSSMINLMVEWDVLSWTEIENGVERKRNKLKRWSKLIEDAEWEKTVKEESSSR